MQRIRPALAALEDEIDVAHALASQTLYTDGAELLFDYADRHRTTSDGRSALELVVLRNGQRVFVPVIESYLRRIEYGADGYATVIHVPAYRTCRSGRRSDASVRRTGLRAWWSTRVGRTGALLGRRLSRGTRG
jgi:hypothetical protein